MDGTSRGIIGGRLEVGASIGSWARNTGFPNWNRFAAVNDEFIPIHMDDGAARAAGMPGAFGMGNLLASYLHALVREWMGDQGRIQRFTVQFRKPNAKGQVVATGTISAVTEGPEGTAIELDLQITDADGDNLAPATATVLFAGPPAA
jgi:acyl dehydratase